MGRKTMVKIVASLQISKAMTKPEPKAAGVCPIGATSAIALNVRQNIKTSDVPERNLQHKESSLK